MKYLFNHQINNWLDWIMVYRELSEFLPMIKSIFRREKLELEPYLGCMSGTHFVARFGNAVIKIYAPEESGNESGDSITEVLGLMHAEKHGVNNSKLLVYGEIKDRYTFSYIITEYIDGISYENAKKKMIPSQRYEMGRIVSSLCKRINIQVDKFESVDMKKEAAENPRWSEWTESFNRERIRSYGEISNFQKIFVHGDLSENNIILKDGIPYIIDFGECKAAPIQYEYAEIFRFDSDFLRGFFEEKSQDEIIDAAFYGLLLHDFGADILKNHMNIKTCDSLDELRRQIKNFLHCSKLQNGV